MIRGKIKPLIFLTSFVPALFLFTNCSDGHHIDAPSETLSVNIESLGKSCLSASQEIPFNIVFNKPVNSFDSSKLTIRNGKLKSISGGPTIFNGALTPDESNNTISIVYEKKGAKDQEGFLNPTSNEFKVLPIADLLADKISCGPFTAACCIANTNGDAKCWGRGDGGALGQDSTVGIGVTPGDMESLDFIDLGEKVVAISTSGNRHSCAVLESGMAKCWGENGFGQLGYDDTTTRGDGSPAPHDMASLELIDVGGLKQIVTGTDFTCGLLKDGNVKCWGRNNFGQLGVLDTAENRGDEPGEMDNLQIVPLGEPVAQLSAGVSSVCAVLKSGSLKCWGQNNFGQLGYDDSIDRTADTHDLSQLQPVNLGEKVVQVAIISDHTCAVLQPGDVKCWGRNNRGKLGYDDLNNRGDGSAAPYDMISLQPINLGQSAIKVMAGNLFSCAILADQTVKCWGGGTAGANGAGDGLNRGDGSAAPYDMASLQPLPLGSPAVDINGAGAYACVRLAEKKCDLESKPTYKCWGRGTSGQLGNNNNVFIGDDPGEVGAIEPIVNL